MRIPLDRRIAEAYSEGAPLVETLPRYRETFQALYRKMETLHNGETAV
jgi:MinD superfamily P-loop ATPase